MSTPEGVFDLSKYSLETLLCLLSDTATIMSGNVRAAGEPLSFWYELHNLIESRIESELSKEEPVICK